MKNVILSMLFIFLLIASSCQHEASIPEVMGSEVVRQEVYATIMNNPEMRQEMMQVMQEHPEGGMMTGRGHMMMGDTAGMMMTDMTPEEMHNRMQQMISACAQDSANCNVMTQMMMNNRQMMQHMMQQMHQQNVVNDACYQQMMQNMNRTQR